MLFNIKDHNDRLLTVCIPASDMNGKASEFLRNNLNILSNQSFKNFDIVITDNSKTNILSKICDEYRNILNIHYYHNWRNIGMVANVNKSIKKAQGKIIKILFLDDYLFSKDSLKDIVDYFDLNNDKWLITACEHTKNGKDLYWPFYPKYNDNIHIGENTISSPSVLSIKNDRPLLFDKKLLWLMDCDYYKRCYIKFGSPKILNKINVVNRIGDHQSSNTTANKMIRGKDYRYVLKKYNEKKLLREYDNKVTNIYIIKRFLRKYKLINSIKDIIRNYFN